MAKTSMIEREKRRAKAVKKYAAKRAKLKEQIRDPKGSQEDRMAAVDRNVLRLAAYELLYSETPASVVLDEAIELARDFGSERSPAFVNGVLDALARERHGALGRAEASDG